MPSSVIRRFAYDPQTSSLEVEFVSGRRYRYAPVPEELAARFRAAFSKGRFFNAHIRDAFACVELPDDAPGRAWSTLGRPVDHPERASAAVAVEHLQAVDHEAVAHGPHVDLGTGHEA